MYTGNVSAMLQMYAFAYLFIQNSCKDLNCMIFEAIKLYYSSKYPFKVQAESDYTCVDLNNEVQFEDFPSKTNLLSKSITNRIWSFFYDIYYYYFFKWAPVLNMLIAWFKHKEKVYFYTNKFFNALKVLIKHDDILA